MSNIRLAKRYAEGLWDYAVSVQEEAIIVKEAKSIIELIKSSKDFKLFLVSPIIETEKKITIANEIFKSFSKTSQNFLTIIFQHKRERDIEEIAKQLLKLNDSHQGIKRATITSAIPLTEDTVSLIISQTEIDTSKIRVENKIDKSIIGGYVLRIDDFQLDTSVNTQLENIKTKFKEKVY